MERQPLLPSSSPLLSLPLSPPLVTSLPSFSCFARHLLLLLSRLLSCVRVLLRECCSDLQGFRLPRHSRWKSGCDELAAEAVGWRDVESRSTRVPFSHAGDPCSLNGNWGENVSPLLSSRSSSLVSLRESCGSLQSALAGAPGNRRRRKQVGLLMRTSTKRCMQGLRCESSERRDP